MDQELKEFIEHWMGKLWESLQDASKSFKDWTDLEKETYYRYDTFEWMLDKIEDLIRTNNG